MPDPTRIFRRLKRKILPRKARKALSTFLWRTSGVTFEIGGLIVALWGVMLLIKTPSVQYVDGIMVTNWTRSLSFLIIGVGTYALGFSIRRLYRHSLGQIESRYVKGEKEAKE